MLPPEVGIFGPMLLSFLVKFFMGFSSPESMAQTSRDVTESLERWGLRDSEIHLALSAIAIGAGARFFYNLFRFFFPCLLFFFKVFFKVFSTCEKKRRKKIFRTVCFFFSPFSLRSFPGTLMASHVTDSFFWIVAEFTRYDMFRMMLVYKLGTFLIGLVTCFLVWLLMVNLYAGIGVMVAFIVLTLIFVVCATCGSGVCRKLRDRERERERGREGERERGRGREGERERREERGRETQFFFLAPNSRLANCFRLFKAVSSDEQREMISNKKTHVTLKKSTLGCVLNSSWREDRTPQSTILG
jgi:hypothetical protein